ncbi:hypothetical protein NDU88_005148 [Pleurodeles waltl]|uniref:Uncharacterized protein n=1 Tax=Pleurodeles waltl TaxID=8319 RepID=A0AAV7RN98_PLEWA|nr:hypothetical protein NDU88_005148 [Pleurodeles waltl]
MSRFMQSRWLAGVVDSGARCPGGGSAGSGTRSLVSGDGDILIELQLRGPVEGSKDFAIVCSARSHLRGFCSRPHLFWAPEGGPGFQVPLTLEGCFTRAPAQLPLIWFIAFHSISRRITLLMWGARGPRRGRHSSCASLSPLGESWGLSPRSPMRPGDCGVSAAGPGVSITLSVHRGPSARRPPRPGAWGGCAAGDAPILVPRPSDKSRRTPPPRGGPDQGTERLLMGRRPSRVSPSRLGGIPGEPLSRRRERRAVSAHGPRHGQRPLSQPPVPRSPLSGIQRGFATGGPPLAAPTPLGRISEDPVFQAVRTPQLRVSATRYVRGTAGGTRGSVRGPGQRRPTSSRGPRPEAQCRVFLVSHCTQSIHIRGQVIQQRPSRGSPALAAILAFGPRPANGVRPNHRSHQRGPSEMGRPRGQPARHLQIAKS